MSRRRLVILTCALIAFVTSFSVYYWVVAPLLKMPSGMRQANRALLSDQVLAIGSVDIRQAVLIEKVLLGVSDSELAKQYGFEHDVFLKLEELGIRPRHDVDYVTAALYHTERDFSWSAIAVGRFNPHRTIELIKEHFKPEIETWGSYQLLTIPRVDPDSCRPKTSVTLYVGSEFLVVAPKDMIKYTISYLYGESKPSAHLAEWETFQESRVASAALFVPSDEVLKNASDPAMKAGVRLASEHIKDLSRAYLGGGFHLAPPSASLRAEVIFAGGNTEIQKKIQSWHDLLHSKQEEYRKTLPSLSRLLENSQLDVTSQVAVFEAGLSRETAKHLKAMPDELLSAFFQDIGITHAGSGEALVEERLESEPFQPVEVANAQSLAAFEPDQVKTAGAFTDHVGPFGLRVERLGFVATREQNAAANEGAESQGSAQLEIKIEALASEPPNIKKAPQRAVLFVDEVLNSKGENVLDRPTCGEARVGKPAPFQSSGPHIRALKVVRLKPGVGVQDVSSIQGRVELDLPKKVEEIRLMPRANELAKRDQVAFKIVNTQSGQFNYQLYGDKNSVLAMQALNKQGQPLAQQWSASSDFLFGGGGSGTVAFAGSIEFIQVFIPKESENVRFDFSIANITPKASKWLMPDQVPPKRNQFEPYSYKRLEKEHKVHGAGKNEWPQLQEQSFFQSAEPAQKVRVGPLAIERRRAGFLGLSLTVQAPPAHEWARYPQAVQFEVSKYVLKNGTTVTPQQGDLSHGEGLVTSPWRIVLPLDYRNFSIAMDPKTKTRTASSNWYLEGSEFINPPRSVSLSDIQSADGHIVMRFPKTVEFVDFDPYQLGAEFQSGEVKGRVKEIAMESIGLLMESGSGGLLGYAQMTARGELHEKKAIQPKLGDAGLEISLENGEDAERIRLYYAPEWNEERMPFMLEF